MQRWGFNPTELRVMEIAYLEGDIAKAIANLKQAMTKHYIISSSIKFQAMYKQLRQHPEWPAILAESDKRAAIQRELYLKLVAEAQ